MKIRIASLSDGESWWQDVISPAVVDLDPGKFPSPLNVELNVNKHTGRVIIEVSVQTEQKTVCDRCCQDFVSKVSGKCKVIFTQRESILPDEDAGDEFRYYLLGQNELDVSTEVRDALILSIPIQNLCSENCRGLCVKCGFNLNSQACICVQEAQEAKEVQ